MLQALALIFYIAVINYCLEVGNQQKAAEGLNWS